MNELDIMGGDIQPRFVEALRLDPLNPRLARTLRGATQEELLKALYESHDIEPLILSLAQSGYFSEEPLIGVQHVNGPQENGPQENGPQENGPQENGPQENGSQRNAFVIVEGNRRLAALQILLFDWAQRAVGNPELPEIGDGIRSRLNPVPVKEYETREAVIPYLGVRHIRGVKDWEALAKARYVEDLKISGYELREISRLVGDRGDVVRRWLLTLYVLDQANDVSETPWDEAVNEFKFSWLYTSLGYARIRSYLGLEEASRRNPEPNPISDSHTRSLVDHMNDLYGPPPGDPNKASVPESRDIRRLAAVYASSAALDFLRGGGSLEDAYARSSGEHEELLDHLRIANVHLERANAMAHRHRNEEGAIQRAEQAAGTAANIIQVLRGPTRL